MKIGEFFKTSLVGVGQIFLQDNAWSGVLITIGMFFSHWSLGVTCILGAMVGTLTANVLKFKKEDVIFGLYGFNGSLAYMCALFTYGLVDGANTDAYSPIVWILGAISAVIATLIMNLFVRNGKTAFTFPFVVTCWVTCCLFSKLGVFGLVQTTPALPDYTATVPAINTHFFGWAEVNFGANLITGILIFLGMAINNASVAMWGSAAAVLGAAFAHYIFGVDANVLSNGIYSFSPILVACAFITFAGDQIKIKEFFYVVVGVFLAVLIHHGVANLTIVPSSPGWATYTIGFIVASWIMLVVKGAFEKSNPDLEKVFRSLNP